MVVLNVDDDVYERAKKTVEMNRVDYPSIKNFVDKAIREKVRIEMIRRAEEKMD